MEKNTFATSAYIGVEPQTAFRYLQDLTKLGEWTLYSRMKEQVDEDTWIGTASGYQQSLYYHIRRFEGLPFAGFEWQCGLEYKQYYHVYPVFLFPSDYAEPGTSANGVYFHWISFVGPKRRTPLIMEGIDIVHTSEARALKAALERSAGLRGPAAGRCRVKTHSVYVDAPFELLTGYLTDLANMTDWGHLWRAQGAVSPSQGTFLDEYGHPLTLATQAYDFSDSCMIEYEAAYRDSNLRTRTLALVVPCAHAFGEPSARGCILHRLTFVAVAEAGSRPYPRDDIAAENLNIKRLAEARAGNVASLARGFSYVATEEYRTA